jgi:hypothetical protein
MMNHKRNEKIWSQMERKLLPTTMYGFQQKQNLEGNLQKRKPVSEQKEEKAQVDRLSFLFQTVGKEE